LICPPKTHFWLKKKPLKSIPYFHFWNLCWLVRLIFEHEVTALVSNYPHLLP